MSPLLEKRVAPPESFVFPLFFSLPRILGLREVEAKRIVEAADLVERRQEAGQSSAICSENVRTSVGVSIRPLSIGHVCYFSIDHNYPLAT